MVNVNSSLKLLTNNRALVRWATILFLILLAWQVGRSGSLMLQSSNIPLLPVLTQAKQSEQTVQGEHSYLMGKPDLRSLKTSASTMSAESISEIANTRLKLKLIGVIDLEGAGVAIIQSSGSNLVVGEGEEIVKGVDLIEVYSDQVIISHRGKREKLMMEEATKGLIEQRSEETSSTPQSRLSVEDSQALKEIGDSLRKSPISISKYVRFKPIGKNGDWSAVKVWPKSNAELFHSLGLKSGDLVKSVNGRTIQEMSQEPSLWQAFLNESQFELTVERQGKIVSLSVDLN